MNPWANVAQAAIPVLQDALRTGGGILGSSSGGPVGGTQGNTSVFSSPFVVGSGRVSNNPSVSPTTSGSPVIQDDSGGTAPGGVGGAGTVGGINLVTVGAVVGIIAGGLVIMKAVR